MSRAYYINGETMVLVKGRSDSSIGTLSQLGLCSESIRIGVNYDHLDIRVDAYGNSPPELQFMGAEATVDMTLVHFDYDVLMACVRESMGSTPAEGQLGHAGSLMGNNQPRFGPGGVAGNHFVGLNIQSALGAPPWRFYFAQLAGQPMDFPVGSERTLVRLRWRVLPHSNDPWNNGNGSFGVPLWDHVLDV